MNQLGSAKAYATIDSAYTLIGPLPRGEYEIALITAGKVSPQGGSNIKTLMDAGDGAALLYAARASVPATPLPYFTVRYDAVTGAGGPDDRYIAVKNTTGAGTITIVPRRVGTALP